jgi:gamma-glutamyl-gamma-aminobutyrate hydrolase PuuD
LLYGQQPHTKTDPTVDFRRSIFELALIAETFKTKIPAHFICRSAQMLAVYLGAEIIQHIGEHNRDAFNKKYVIAEIVTEEGKSTKVPSYHHQGIAAKGMPKDDIKIIATQQVLVTPQNTIDLLEGFTSTMVNSVQAVKLVQWFSTEDNRITAT